MRISRGLVIAVGLAAALAAPAAAGAATPVVTSVEPTPDLTTISWSLPAGELSLPAGFAVHHGYEIQIQDNNDEFHRTGAVYSISPAKAGAAKRPGEWNTMEITLNGDRISVSLNGQEITRFDPATAKIPPRKESWEPQLGPRPEVGYIGLQNHSDKDTVWFRKVSVRPLNR